MHLQSPAVAVPVVDSRVNLIKVVAVVVIPPLLYSKAAVVAQPSAMMPLVAVAAAVTKVRKSGHRTRMVITLAQTLPSRSAVALL
jgi:hypothetical protein